jgi:hypothetical protein
MPVRIGSEFMAAEVDGAVVATARWSWYAAADGSGVWIASTHTSLLFTRDEAISAMAPRVAAGERARRRRSAGDIAPQELTWRQTGSSG